MKPGVSSTEFWITLGAALVSVLTASGVFNPAQSDALLNGITQLVGSVGAILAAMNYTNSRGKVKSNEQKAGAGKTETELLKKELELTKKELEMTKKEIPITE